MASRTSLRLRFLSRIPSRLSGTNGIKVTKDELDFIISPDTPALVIVPSIAALDTTFIQVYDAATDAYARISGSDLLENIQDVIIGPNLTGFDALVSGENRVPIFLDDDGNSTTYTVSPFVQTASSAIDASAFRDAIGVLSVAQATVDVLSVAAAQAFSFPATRKQIRTQFYAPNFTIPETLVGGAAYRRISLADLSGYPELSYFRTVDRFMPDETTDATNGGYWVIDEHTILAEMFGASPNSSAADNSKAVNEAIQLRHLLGGGEVRVSAPGTYLLANTNPYPAAEYPGLSESDANWWANRRAVYIPYDNITLWLGEGVTLKVGNAENCHAIQLGQFSLGMGGFGPAISAVSINNSRVVGHAWSIDMNGANQTPATDTKDHPAGIIINHGSERIEISGGTITNSAYYGIGFEGTDSDAQRGYRNCYVHDMVIENCKADGFDAKDFGTLSSGNVLARITVRNVGNGGGVFLTGQAGIDTRGGWTVEDCNVYYDDAFTGERTGFRSQYAPDFAQSADPTHFIRCSFVGNGKDNANTVGFRLSGRNARADDCVASGVNEGFRVSAPKHVLRGLTARVCGIAYRFFTDTGAGWDADNSILRDSFAETCDVGWRTETGVSSVQIDGGALTSVGTALVDNGTSTHIKGVAGFLTSSRAAVAFRVDTTGLKTVTVAHGLPVTPALADVQVTLQKGAVLDYAATVAVTAVDATNVTIEAFVTVASATALSNGLARVVVDTKR